MAISEDAVQSILQAMEIISTAKLNDISYDKTIICTIADNSRAAQESYYTVTDGSVRFKAYVTSTEDASKYKVNDQVYVKIPNGDYSQQKIIEGYYVAENEVVPVTYVSPLDTFLGMSELTAENGSQSNIIEGLTANDAAAAVNPIPIWQWSADVSQDVVDDLQVNGIYDTIGLQASFKCLLDKYKICKGSYGLRLDLYVRLNVTSSKHIIKSIYLDSSEMFGNPYSFTLYATQAKTVDISNLGTIDGMTLYFYQNNDFEYYDGREKKVLPVELSSNIFVKDVYIAFGSEMSSITDNTIKLYNTENSSFNFTQPNDSTNTKHLGFLWYNKTDSNDYIGFSDGVVDVEEVEVTIQESKGDIRVCSYTDENGSTQTIEVHKDNIRIERDVEKEKDIYYTAIGGIKPYDELKYIEESNEDSRLIEQCAKNVPTDKNGLEISANVAEGEVLFGEVTKLIQVDLVNTLRDFYQRTKSLAGIKDGDETLSSNDYFNDAENGKVNIANKYGKDIEEDYKSLIDWYITALDAAAAIEAHQDAKTEPESVVKIDYEDKFKAIESSYETFKSNYIDSNGFILTPLKNLISEYYSAFQSVYDIYSIKIEKIFNQLTTKFDRLHVLFFEKEASVTSNNDTGLDAADEAAAAYQYVLKRPIIKYTAKDFSHLNNRYCVYWYRYTPGHVDEDGIVEDGWKRLIPDEEIQSSTVDSSKMLDNLGLPTTFNLVDNKVYYLDTRPASTEGYLTVYLDPYMQEEKFKVVIFYNHEKFESNELVFTNLETVPDATSMDGTDAISIIHGTNSMESYQTLYGSNNSLINQGHSSVNRKLLLNYDGLLGGNELLIGASVYWYIPRNSTMLTVNASQLTALTDDEVPRFSSDFYRTAKVKKNNAQVYIGPGANYNKAKISYSAGTIIQSIYDLKDGYYSLKSTNAIGVGGQWISADDVDIVINEESNMDGYACFYKVIGADEDGNVNAEDLEFEYRIKNYYVPTALNNTIFCIVKKNDYEFETSISMIFGTQGTSGTDYTILVQPAGNQLAVNEPLSLMVQGYDYNNNEIPIQTSSGVGVLYNPVVKWRGPSVYDLSFVPEDAGEGTVINSAQVVVNDNEAQTYTYTHKYQNNGVQATKDYDLTNYCGIAEITVNLSDKEAYSGSTKELTVWYPVPWSAGDYYIEGPTSVIYDSSGSNPSYYKEPYRIYNATTNEEITNVKWNIKYFMQKKVSYSSSNAVAPLYLIGVNEIFPVSSEVHNQVYKLTKNGDNYVAELVSEKGNEALLEEVSFYRNYMPKLDDTNKLIPSNIYIGEVYNDDLGQYDGYLNAYPVVHCYDSNNVLIWAQPLVILQNRYPNAMINAWDGNFKIDEENGTILSTMVGAGYKNTDNTYSGVLMGKVDGVADDNKSDVGVYGFHHGAQSFGLNIDGTAFFGKSGRGRILIDGNSSTISSASYQQTRTGTGTADAGMMIDLDDGFIDMLGAKVDNGAYNSTGSQVHLDVKTPYFYIVSEQGKRLINIGDKTKFDFANYPYELNAEGEIVLTDSATEDWLEPNGANLSKGYYLKSNDFTYAAFNKNDGTPNGQGSGFLLDLTNGYINAFNLSLASKNIFIDSSNDANPFFVVKDNDGCNLIYAGSDRFYIQSHSYSQYIRKDENYIAQPQPGIRMNLQVSDQNDILLSVRGVNKPLIYVGNPLKDKENYSFYLQTDNYQARTVDTEGNITYGSGMRLDLKNGSIKAYDFTLRGEASTGNYAGSYFLLDSRKASTNSSSPELVFHVIDKEQNYDTTMLYISGTDYYLQSLDWDNTSSDTTIEYEVGKVVNVTTVLNIRSGPGTQYTDIGNLKQDDEVVIYGKSEDGKWYKISLGDEYVSSEYIEITGTTSIKTSSDSSKGMRIDMKSGYINAINSKNTAQSLKINAGATTYPLQIGVGTDNLNFRVGWDGSVHGGSSSPWSITADGKATFKNLSITSYGSLSGCYIYNATIKNAEINSGTIGGCTIGEGSISGSDWSLSNGVANFESITMGGEKLSKKAVTTKGYWKPGNVEMGSLGGFPYVRDGTVTLNLEAKVKIGLGEYDVEFTTASATFNPTTRYFHFVPGVTIQYIGSDPVEESTNSNSTDDNGTDSESEE